MNIKPTMTPTDVERVAHEVRLQIQQSTCCPLHAGEVLMRVLAGFALDEANDNQHQAAATIHEGGQAVMPNSFALAVSS